MWSHYANNHEGFVIGFDSKHTFFEYGVVEVLYREERPYLNPIQTEQDASVFYTKSNDWKYEEEYKKSMSFVEPIKMENGHSLLPFPDKPPHPDDEILKKVHLFDFPKDSVTAIIFGWRSNSSLENRLISALKTNGIHDVNICKAIPHKRKYEMTIKEIKKT